MPVNSRRRLHGLLVEALGSDHVYYQPPETVKMVYPCIVYAHASMINMYAEDTKYIKYDVYDVTYIYKDPTDQSVTDALLDLDYSEFDRAYVADNLYHEVYRISIKH